MTITVPTIHGIIDRRILVNYRVNPDVIARVLPTPFRPKLVNGYAMAGICLIRLKRIRPRLFPLPWGIGSENAAHRIAVEWDVDGEAQDGVFIPRRDTDSVLNTWVGGRLFPGVHHHASFTVHETANRFSVAVRSDDGTTRVLVSGVITDRLPSTSVFSSASDASEFFRLGSLGYSTTKTQGRYDGIELRCEQWHADPLELDKVESSYFDNEVIFPPGSVTLDCGLLMRAIHHEWHGCKDLCCPASSG